MEAPQRLNSTLLGHNKEVKNYQNNTQEQIPARRPMKLTVRLRELILPALRGYGNATEYPLENFHKK
jgi:hypothetical protein